MTISVDFGGLTTTQTTSHGVPVQGAPREVNAPSDRCGIGYAPVGRRASRANAARLAVTPLRSRCCWNTGSARVPSCHHAAKAARLRGLPRHIESSNLAGVSRGRMTPEEALGQALREARLKVGLSQEDLGEACGRHRTYISLLERGKHSPSIKTLFSVAAVLETTPWRLLKRADALLSE